MFKVLLMTAVFAMTTQAQANIVVSIPFKGEVKMTAEGSGSFFYPVLKFQTGKANQVGRLACVTEGRKRLVVGVRTAQRWNAETEIGEMNAKIESCTQEALEKIEAEIKRLGSGRLVLSTQEEPQVLGE